MTYGALITAPNGQAFVTPESTPLALHSVASFTSSEVSGYQRVTGYMPVPDINKPILPFLISNQPARGAPALSAGVIADGRLEINGINIFNDQFTITAFLFTHFAQPVPNPPWGMAIWDANRQLILTHETRVLTDLTTVGQRGVNSNSGFFINTTMPGRWAIVPQCSGQQVWRVSSGGPGGVLMATPVMFSAVFNGNETRFLSAPTTYIGTGSAQQESGVNNGNVITAIEVSKYL